MGGCLSQSIYAKAVGPLLRDFWGWVLLYYKNGFWFGTPGPPAGRSTVKARRPAGAPQPVV